MELKTNIYQNVNDNELVYLINENSDDAKNMLYEKYSPMLHSELNKVKKTAYALGIEWNDIVQEAMLGFSSAINSYNEQEEATFGTYATICVRRKILNYIEKNRSIKNQTFKQALSIDIENSDHTSIIEDKDSADPLKQIITEESLDEIRKRLTFLSNDELSVIKYKIEGLTSQEISKKMNIPIKKVYNLSQRAKERLKRKKS